MNKTVYYSKSESESNKIAKIIFESNKENKLFIFIGDVGVGKTFFIKKFASLLEYKGIITSPTFGVKNEYSTKTIKFVHYDLYLNDRNINTRQFISLLNEDLNNNDYVFLEWGDKIKKRNLNKAVTIRIKIIDNEEREIMVS